MEHREYASHEASNGETLGQAITMLRIAAEIARDYLDKRIRVGTLNSYGLWSFLKRELASMRVLTLKELDDQIRQRKAELGIAGRPSAPPNSGRRRTDSKGALLQKLKDAADAQGRELPFKAKF